MAAEIQKSMKIDYSPQVITAIAPIHRVNGDVHLMQPYVEQAASFIRVHSECYNKVSRSSTSVGLGVGGVMLGVSDSRMKETQKLVGIITGGCFFFVKNRCMVCLCYFHS